MDKILHRPGTSNAGGFLMELAVAGRRIGSRSSPRPPWTRAETLGPIKNRLGHLVHPGLLFVLISRTPSRESAESSMCLSWTAPVSPISKPPGSISSSLVNIPRDEGPKAITRLVALHRLRADPEGNIEILDRFWHFPVDPAMPDRYPRSSPTRTS